MKQLKQWKPNWLNPLFFTFLIKRETLPLIQTNKYMNLKKQLLLVASAGLLAAGCGSADFKKNKEGLVYKIISDGKGEQIKPGQLLKLNFSSQIGDSVMFSTFDH